MNNACLLTVAQEGILKQHLATKIEISLLNESEARRKTRNATADLKVQNFNSRKIGIITDSPESLRDKSLRYKLRYRYVIIV